MTKVYVLPSGKSYIDGELNWLEDGTSFFANNKNITTLDTDLPNLQIGTKMFYETTALKHFSGDLSNLRTGDKMFAGAELTEFAVDMPYLQSAVGMFQHAGPNTAYARGPLLFTSDVHSLENADNMFAGKGHAVYFNIPNGIPSLSSANNMFKGGSSYGAINNLAASLDWNYDISNLTQAQYMFQNCKSLKTFESDFKYLTTASYMFAGCSNLTSIKSNFVVLNAASCMFQGCSNLTSFECDTPYLSNANSMFRDCSNLSSFECDTPNLSNANYMFQGCSNLTSFNTTSENLQSANSMFQGCTNLTSFDANCTYLNYASSMFGSTINNCTKLDLASVQKIANSIKQISKGSISLGISATLKGNTDIQVAISNIKNKGWTVTEIYA